MVKTHRVGTLTLGCMLVTFGVLFLLRLLITTLSFSIIFKLWPIIFLFLGLEILAANLRHKDTSFLYDKTAFALIIILSFFAMGMSMMEFVMEHVNNGVI